MPPRIARKSEEMWAPQNLEKRVMGRHKSLLSDPKVRSWWEARSLRSTQSADQLLRVFGLVLERTNLDPERLVKMARKEPNHLRDTLVKLATDLKKEGRLDTYIAKLFEGIKAYLKFQNVPFDSYPELSPIQGASLGNERVPTPEELGRILDRMTLRGRVIALFMAHTGVRPGVLGAYQGERGLTLGDLPNLVTEPELSFKEVPFLINIPAALSKTRRSYKTFGTSQLANAYIAYLHERRERGEELAPRSPVVVSSSTRGAALTSQKEARFSRGFLTTKAIVEEMRTSLQSSVPKGVRWRPYVLRAYCSTRLLMAEGAGKITRDLREAILGHNGGIAARYNVGKAWGEDLLKEARASYSRCEPYLVTVVTERENVPQEVAKAMLQLAGFAEEEIQEMDLSDLAAVRDRVRDRLGASDAPRQEVVPIGEVPQRLSAGWQFVAALGTTQAILTSPSSPRTSPIPGVSALPPRVAASPGPPAGGGSRGGGSPTASGGGGPSLPPLMPPRASGRPGENPSAVSHRVGAERGSPGEDSPEPH